MANGQISQEVADMLIKSGSSSNTGLSGIDPRLLKALQTNPGLIKQLQGPDGKIDPDLIKEFTENGGELSDDQLRVIETGTLPPEIADVPPNIAAEAAAAAPRSKPAGDPDVEVGSRPPPGPPPALLNNRKKSLD